MRHVAPSAASVLLVVGASAGEPLAAAWLDAKLIVSWNQAGLSLPTPPKIDGVPLATGRCAEQLRKPVGAPDQAVMRAGWSLVGALQLLNDRALVTAAVAADGMCRPLGYQAFVFVAGRFAGTLSPQPMNARSDGMLKSAQLYDRMVFASFNRYAEADPLCCPTRTTEVSYRIDTGAADPLLVPGAAETRPNPR